MDWTKQTFDENYLEAFRHLYKDSKKDVKDIIDLTKIKKSQNILDTCCGWGRHVIEFDKKGYKIQGIDFCNDFIKFAKNNYPSIIISKKDIRYLNLKTKFDLILNLETSFGYYNDKTNRKILRNIYSRLNNEGKFLLDIINKDFILKNFKRKLILYNKKDIKIEDFNKFNRKRSNMTTLRMIKIRGKEYYKKINLKLYNKNQIFNILNEAGFKKVHFFSNFKGKKCTKDSKRLVILAKK